jgi:hypothetical protein
VCWIDPINTFRLYRFFPTVFKGEHIEMPEVKYYRASTVQVETSVPMDFYGDGSTSVKPLHPSPSSPGLAGAGTITAGSRSQESGTKKRGFSQSWILNPDSRILTPDS